MGLGTVMGKNPDGTTHSLAHLQTTTTSNSSARPLLDVHRRAARLASSLSLGAGIVEKTMHLYKAALESGAFKSRKSELLVVTCMYCACKMEGGNSIRSLKEMCLISKAGTGVELKAKHIAKCFNQLKNLQIVKKHRAANFEAMKQDASAHATQQAASNASASAASLSPSAAAMTPSLNPTIVAQLERYAALLTLPLALTTTAIQILQTVHEKGLLEGKLPQTVAGAVIFLVTQLSSLLPPTPNCPPSLRSLESISNVTHTAASTLSTAYQALWQSRAQIVPPSFLPIETVISLPLQIR